MARFTNTEWLPPLGVARSPVPRDAEPPLGVSRSNLQRLANDLASASGRLFNEVSICFKNKGDRLLKIRSGFLKGGPLRVRTRQFLNEADVALGNFPEYGGQIQVHGPIIGCGNRGLTPAWSRRGQDNGRGRR